MKRKNLAIGISFIALSFVAILMTGCGLFSSKQEKVSAADSLTIAQDLIKRNPEIVRSFQVKFSEKKTGPIDSTTLARYKQQYDDLALLREPDSADKPGRAYRGFRIDSFGFDFLKKGRYDAVYIRLGRNDLKQNTFMLMPMLKGRAVQINHRPKTMGPNGKQQDPNENLDHLDPCPGPGCPENFDNK